MSQFSRSKLILELALTQSSSANSPSNREDERQVSNLDPNQVTSTEDAFCEVNPDGSTILDPSIGRYNLVPDGDDNCFILEPIDHQPGLLTEINDCVVVEKFSDQPQTETSLKEDCLLSPFNMSLDVNYLDHDILSTVEIEDSVAQVDHNTVLSNDKNNEGDTKNEKGAEKISGDDVEDDVYIPSREESDASENVDDINLEEENNVSENDHNYSKEFLPKRKRAKRGKANKESWVANENKHKRSRGQEYFGRRKTEEGKIVFDVKKPKKVMKGRCSCPPKNLRTFGCARISDSMRENIFIQFYSLNKGEKQLFMGINGLVDKKPVAQRRVEAPDTSRRNYSFAYYLKPEGAKERIKVCKRMFLATLGIGEWAVHDWVSKISHRDSAITKTNGKNAEVEEKRKEKKTSLRPTQATEERKLLLEFFESLPKLESHYCRKKSTKLYLEPKWQSKAELFRLYKDFCQSHNTDGLTASIFTFYSVFDECNLALFSPKKDQCDTCCAHKTGTLSEEEFKEHVLRKDKARQEKENDKASADKTSVFTMDLQAVLLCPSLNASALYYRTKLKVHNFTLYNLKTGAGHCYLWDETEGELSADEFASILYHFLTTEVVRETCDNVIIYSDGCTYQNRNAIMANTLLLASKKLDITITQKFLEKGHTQMECDAMHSCIERRLKNREIYSPVAYTEACRTARLHPAPYKVQYLQHSFFKKFSDLRFVSSIRPGQNKGDPVVTNLKCIKYTPDGNMQIKLDFEDEFCDLPRRIKNPSSDTEIKRLHKNKVPLKPIKFQHLQEMKSVLPRQVHSYYDSLPHLSKSGNKLCEKEICSCIIPANVDF